MSWFLNFRHFQQFVSLRFRSGFISLVLHYICLFQFNWKSIVTIILFSGILTPSRRFYSRFDSPEMDDAWDFMRPKLEDLDRQLDRYLLAIKQKTDATGLVCLAIALQLIENRDKLRTLPIRAYSPAQPQFNIPAVGDAPEITVHFNAAAIEAIPATYGVARKHFYSMVLQAYPVAWKWIVQLTACSQVHRLQIKDVANYFNQFPEFKKITSFNGHEVDCTAVLRYVEFTASQIKWPKHQILVANDEIRANFLSDSSFVKHHTTFSATAGLCRQFIDGLGGSHAKELQINEKMIEAVDRSLANYWDPVLNREIPVQLVAMAAVYAQVCGRDYGNWIQGKRALSRTDPMFVDTWKNLFKHWSK